MFADGGSQMTLLFLQVCITSFRALAESSQNTAFVMGGLSFCDDLSQNYHGFREDRSWCEGGSLNKRYRVGYSDLLLIAAVFLNACFVFSVCKYALLPQLCHHI